MLKKKQDTTSIDMTIYKQLIYFLCTTNHYLPSPIMIFEFTGGKFVILISNPVFVNVS